jgi:prepilin-type N-terminal cleavage/methylation domain-containing protein
MRRQRSRHAFTLIELMVVVGIVGVLSSVAIPSFTMMVRRSKSAETAGNLDGMFKTAAAYYASERSTQGNVSTTSGHCTVKDGGPAPADPRPGKQVVPTDESFRALGFTIADMVYYSYGLATSSSGASTCANPAKSPALYTFYAHGDLDGDGLRSTFELTAGSDETNFLYHSRSLFIDHETE